MDKKQFVTNALNDFAAQYPDATDSEMEQIYNSASQKFDTDNPIAPKPESASQAPVRPTSYNPSVVAENFIQDNPSVESAGQFGANIVNDIPSFVGKVTEMGTGFGAEVGKGAVKSVQTLLNTAGEKINPFYDKTEADLEAERQNTDTSYDTIKRAFAEGAGNIDQYYHGERPEFNAYAEAQPKTELYPPDYYERLARVKAKLKQIVDQKNTTVRQLEQIPGARELFGAAEAIPQFIGQSAANLGTTAGKLYEGDPEATQTFYEKPLSTSGIDALGVAAPIIGALRVGERYEKAKGAKLKKEGPLTPEEADNAKKFDEELAQAQATDDYQPTEDQRGLENQMPPQSKIAPKTVTAPGPQVSAMENEDNFYNQMDQDVENKANADLDARTAEQVQKYNEPTNQTIDKLQYIVDNAPEKPPTRDIMRAKQEANGLLNNVRLLQEKGMVTKELTKKLEPQIEQLKIKLTPPEETPTTPNVMPGLRQKFLEQYQNAKQPERQNPIDVRPEDVDFFNTPPQGTVLPPKNGTRTIYKGNKNSTLKDFLTSEEGSLNIGPVVDKFSQAYKAGREAMFAARQKAESLGNFGDNVISYLFEKFHPALKAIGAVGPNEKEKAFESIEKNRYADNLMKEFLKDSGFAENMVKDLRGAGLDLDHFGTYARARRVLFEREARGLKSDMTHDEAVAVMNEYTLKQKAALVKTFNELQNNWQKYIVPQIINSGVFNPKINDYIRNNNNYSRDVVIEHAPELAAGGDKRGQQIMQHLSEYGTTKGTLNPVEQMIIYARQLNQFTSREVMKRTLVDGLEKAGEIANNPQRDYEPVRYMQNGEWVEKYAPKDIAFALNETPVEMSKAAKAMDWLAFGNPISKWSMRQIITNPAFVLGNSLLLDPITTWAQLPSVRSIYGYPIVHVLTMLEKAGSKVAGKIARSFGLEDLNKVQSEMARRKVYNISSLYDKTTGGETQLGSMMEGLGLNENVQEFFTGKKNWVSKGYGAFEAMANRVDNSSKESLFRYLNAYEKWRGEDKINQMTREMGTPATKRAGEGEAVLRRTTLFGNAVLQALKATGQNIKDSPVSFALKNIGVPVALAYAMNQHIQNNPELKHAYNTLSDYQKRNFLNIYTGKGTNAQPLFFSLPMSRIGRIAYGLALDVLQHDTSFAKTAKTVLEGATQNALQELPGSFAQPINMAIDTGNYISGKSPYDRYRGKDVIPKQIMDADSTLWNMLFGDSKMNDLSTTKAFGSYMLNAYAIGGWFKMDSLKNTPEGYEWSKFGPFNRAFRFGGSGVQSELYKAKEEEAKYGERAKVLLKNEARASNEEKRPINFSPEINEALTYSPRTFITELQKLALKNQKNATGAEILDLITTFKGATPREQMAIIKRFNELTAKPNK